VIPLAKIRLVLQGNTSVLTSGSANLIKNYAVQAIQGELNSLRPLETFIDDGFVQVVELLLNSNGRVVITGIGKSAIIAQKIVATMNSTGQPAIFMHAADAIHGDLGIIMPDDVVLAISKSGNTPEIKLLAPLLKRFGNKLVAMVGNMSSELAQIADFVINTTIDKEACPNNLAPTTSTTAQLLMGDALAIALLRMRNFSNEDFGRYHPGGALGKKLYLRCGELAKTNAALGDPGVLMKKIDPDRFCSMLVDGLFAKYKLAVKGLRVPPAALPDKVLDLEIKYVLAS